MELKTFSAVPCQNLESSDDGSVGMLAVLDADWSVITKYRGIFDFMNISKFISSATIGRPLSCHVGADQLLTSDINPSVVTRTFASVLSTLQSLSEQIV